MRILRRLGALALIFLFSLAVLGLVVLPVAAATLGPVLIRSAGVASEDLNVQLVTGPALLFGRVDSLVVSSGPLEIEGRFSAADARIELHDVSLTDRTFGSLAVTSSGLTATFASGEVIGAQTLTGSGPGSDVLATARFSRDDLTAMLSHPATAERLGFVATGLRLGDGFVTLETAAGDIVVRLAIDETGDLVLHQDGAADRVLWAAVGEDARDWRLESVTFDPDGATLTARFDVAAFLARYPSLLDLIDGFTPAS